MNKFLFILWGAGEFIMRRRDFKWLLSHTKRTIRDKHFNDPDEDCDHNEHDHGICLDCGKDIINHLVCIAEARLGGDK